MDTSNQFQNKWSTLLFLINVYNFFTCFYFLGVEGFPSGAWMSLEILTESVMVIDMVIRLALSRTDVWRRFWMLHEGTPLACLAVGSLPISMAVSGAADSVD
jgi:hypothetical protein